MRRLLISLCLASSLISQAAGTPVTDVQLINQEGKAFKLHDLRGNFVLLSFLYTKCPMANMCPLNMQLNRRLIEEWKALRKGKSLPLQILGITLDPGNDTPAAMKKFAESYHMDLKHFTLATGDPKALDAFASQFNAVGLPAPDGTISHSMRTILLNPLLVPIAEYKDNSWSPGEVIAEMKKATPWWKRFFNIFTTWK